MKFMNKIERKLGRYAIPNLMKYVVGLYVIGIVIGSFNFELIAHLGLEFDMIAKGQIWRLITFLIPINSMNDIFFVFLKAYVFYMIGNNLERTWGAFRFNFYFLSGIICNILAALIVYLLKDISILGAFGMLLIRPLDVIYISLFFAFAALYPNVQFWVYFIIPVKAKWLALLSGGYYLYVIYQMIESRFYLGIVPIAASLVNFVFFFFVTRDYQRISPREYERKAKFRRQMNEGRNSGNVVSINGRDVIARHKCAICGRTEQDDDQLEFRFCSKCDGNYEYCMEHLFTHEHVKRD